MFWWFFNNEAKICIVFRWPWPALIWDKAEKYLGLIKESEIDSVGGSSNNNEKL